MKTLKRLHTFWQKLTYLGVGNDLSIDDTIKTRLLNIVLFIGITILSPLWIRTLFVQEVGQFIVITSVFLLIIGILLLNINNRQHIARLIIVFGVTISMTITLIFLYPSPWELEYIYLMVIFVNLIFFQGRMQALIILFVTILFIAAHIIEPRLPMEYKVLVPLTPNLPLFFFIFFVLYSSITFTFYQTEIKKYQAAQKKTIDALHDSNMKLTSASEELERFIYVVSSNLKNRLKKVNQSIKKVRNEINQYQYENILQPLDNTENTARQMYFWVNDILEFSTVNNSGQRLENDISFDDLFLTLKDNISSEIDDFENRIIWTNIPTVRLNELEVFIVFYNILKIAFHTTDSDPKIRTVVIQTNRTLSIQFICTTNNFLTENDQKNEKIKLCQLIVEGWNGTINIKDREHHKIYEINIPKNKLS